MEISKTIAPAFEDFIFNWDYETYLLLGGYGSGKSYHIALKIILKLLQEKRKALIIREVYDTLYESCYDLIKEILEDMNLLGETKNRIRACKSPMEFRFPNGSRIIFKGMDKPEKVKSLNGVSIVWIEECSEVKYTGYKELLGRIRTPNESMHFILSCNPVGKENWVYSHFFISQNEKGEKIIFLDDKKLYEKKVIVKDGIYYHHSTLDDNPFLPVKYIKRIEDLQTHDYALFRVARWGMFGVTGIRVLPQFEIVMKRNKDFFIRKIKELGIEKQYFGFDFGFETSYNAVVSMSVDDKNGILYIWDEIYLNKVTDDIFAQNKKMQKLKNRLIEYKEQYGITKLIIADNEDPKAIAYYKQNGFLIRGCRNKFAGSRISNTRKIKRFKRIICSPKCQNVIRELKDLTYLRKPNGEIKYDEFNIDPHTFSAIWYALDTVTVAEIKPKRYNTKKGE